MVLGYFGIGLMHANVEGTKSEWRAMKAVLDAGNHSLRLGKNLSDYLAQSCKPFDHEARIKHLRARQAQLNAAPVLSGNTVSSFAPA